MTITTNDTTTRLNPNATLALCDRCHEHAPRFVVGTGIRARLCPLCAVRADLSALDPMEARGLSEALTAWITTPNPRTDMPADDDFYAQFGDRTWGARELDLEAERQARRELVASYTGEPGETQDDRDAAFMADFWAALTGGIAA